MTSASHSGVPKEKYSSAFPDWWKKFAANYIAILKKVSQTIVEGLSKEIPTYFIRYEDLVLDPEPVLTELFQFILEAQTLEGTVV